MEVKSLMRKFSLLVGILIGTIFIIEGVTGIMGALENINEEKMVYQEAKDLNEKVKQELKNKFEKIELGMTYEDVEKIMESKGSLFSESVSSFGTYQVYLWETGELFEGIELHFQDGKLSVKTQLGLD